MAGKGRGGGSDEGKAEKKEVFHYDLMTGDKLYFIWWLLKEPFFFSLLSVLESLSAPQRGIFF